MTSQLNITVAGAGYVGFTLAAILAEKNIVRVLDIDHDKVRRINSNKSAIEDTGINEFLLSKKIEMTATIDQKESLSHADYVIIATPTNYDPSSGDDTDHTFAYKGDSSKAKMGQVIADIKSGSYANSEKVDEEGKALAEKQAEKEDKEIKQSAVDAF